MNDARWFVVAGALLVVAILVMSSQHGAKNWFAQSARPVVVTNADKERVPSSPAPWETEIGPPGEEQKIAGALSGMAIPIRWHSEDMGFVATVKVGNDLCFAVLDSGSSYLVVATRDCENCLDRHRSYDLANSTTAETTGEVERIQYASLEVEAETVRDDIVFAGVVGCQMPNMRPSDAMDVLKPLRLPKALFHAAHEMEGTHSNVLGLTHPDRSGPNGFLSQLLDAAAGPKPMRASERLTAWLARRFGIRNSRRMWGIECGTDGEGWWTIGETAACRSEHMQWTPLSTEFGFLGTYVVDVESVYAGPSRETMTRIRSSATPEFLLIDTGTPMSYMTSSCSKSMEPAVSSSYWIELRLRNGVRLQYPPEATSEIRINDQVLDTVVGGHKKVMLLGALMMRGLRWVFDIDRARVGIAPGSQWTTKH